MKHSLCWLIPIVVMLIIAPFTPQLDMEISQWFYQSETKTFSTNEFFQFFYTYGELPALFTGVIAAIVIVISFFFSSYKKWRNGALTILLTLVIGGGLITNAILKEYWGRPRPKQVVEFGGTHAFYSFFQPNFSRVDMLKPDLLPMNGSDSNSFPLEARKNKGAILENIIPSFSEPEVRASREKITSNMIAPSIGGKSGLKSFPSGHCAMGFFFLSLYVVGKREKSELLKALGIILTITLGASLTLSRIGQGGHFFSDALMAALIMWLTVLAMEWLVYDWSHEKTT